MRLHHHDADAHSNVDRVRIARNSESGNTGVPRPEEKKATAASSGRQTSAMEPTTELWIFALYLAAGHPGPLNLEDWPASYRPRARA